MKIEIKTKRKGQEKKGGFKLEKKVKVARASNEIMLKVSFWNGKILLSRVGLWFSQGKVPLLTGNSGFKISLWEYMRSVVGHAHLYLTVPSSFWATLSFFKWGNFKIKAFQLVVSGLTFTCFNIYVDMLMKFHPLYSLLLIFFTSGIFFFKPAFLGRMNNNMKGEAGVDNHKREFTLEHHRAQIVPGPQLGQAFQRLDELIRSRKLGLKWASGLFQAQPLQKRKRRITKAPRASCLGCFSRPNWPILLSQYHEQKTGQNFPLPPPITYDAIWLLQIIFKQVNPFHQPNTFGKGYQAPKFSFLKIKR